MKPFVSHKGIVVPLDRVNVDTDQIIPKQFLKSVTRDGLGRALFYDWRYLEGERPNPDFILNRPRYQGASILLARANFGCGSSREHAAWALLDYGIRAVIAPSFADIFFNNCTKNGILPVELKESDIDLLFARAGAPVAYELTVDLQTREITDAQGLKLQFSFDPFRRECLLKGLDDVGITLRHEGLISAYENAHRPDAVMYDRVEGS